jgi:hypothetical protein
MWKACTGQEDEVIKSSDLAVENVNVHFLFSPMSQKNCGWSLQKLILQVAQIPRIGNGISF